LKNIYWYPIINTKSSITGNPGVKECLLAIGGCEIHEVELIKRSFYFLLNHNKKANKNICFNQPDLDYLCKQLFHNTIPGESVQVGSGGKTPKNGMMVEAVIR